jgi:HD-like signal output (HDOD) protein
MIDISNIPTKKGTGFKGTGLLYKINESYLNILKKAFLPESIQPIIANNLQDAQNALEKEAIDFVITDYESDPGESFKFLSHVKSKYPSIYRMVICNADNQKRAIYMVFKGVANSCFEKPHGMVNLMANINSYIALRGILKRKELLKLLSTIENLITLPKTYFEFIKALEENKSTEEIIKILEKDISISSKILQISNSAFYRANKIGSVAQAYDYLGLHNIKNIVTIFCYQSEEKLDEAQNEPFNALIAHSIRVNNEFHSSYQIRVGETLPDSFASIGITHDIGKIIMLKYLPDRFNRVIESLRLDPNDDFYSTEIKLGYKGCTHAEIGAYFLKLWNLPDENVQTALHHHNYEEAPDDYKKILNIFKDVNYDMEICEFTKMFT